MISIRTKINAWLLWLLLAICLFANLEMISGLAELRGLTGGAAAQAEIGLVFFFYILGAPSGLVSCVVLVALFWPVTEQMPFIPILRRPITIAFILNLAISVVAWLLVFFIWR